MNNGSFMLRELLLTAGVYYTGIALWPAGAPVRDVTYSDSLADMIRARGTAGSLLLISSFDPQTAVYFDVYKIV